MQKVRELTRKRRKTKGVQKLNSTATSTTSALHNFARRNLSTLPLEQQTRSSRTVQIVAPSSTGDTHGRAHTRFEPSPLPPGRSKETESFPFPHFLAPSILAGPSLFSPPSLRLSSRCDPLVFLYRKPFPIPKSLADAAPPFETVARLFRFLS